MKSVLPRRRLWLLSGVALLGTWGTTQQAPFWVSSLPPAVKPDLLKTLPVSEQRAEQRRASEARSYTQMTGALGAIIGCILAALAGDRFGRRKTYFVLCIVSMLSIFGLFKTTTASRTPLPSFWKTDTVAFGGSFAKLSLPDPQSSTMRLVNSWPAERTGRSANTIEFGAMPVRTSFPDCSVAPLEFKTISEGTT